MTTKKSEELAIALVSGGMDSLVSAAMANEKHEHMAFLHQNYGHKTEERELESFNNIADFYNIPKNKRKVIDVTFLSQIGGSSLTDSSMNVTSYEGDSNEIPTSYVPFRNTHIVAMAVSWAEVIGAKKIYIGAVEEASSCAPCGDLLICDEDTGECVASICGNGKIETGETCDTGASNSDTLADACRTDCRVAGCARG